MFRSSFAIQRYSSAGLVHNYLISLCFDLCFDGLNPSKIFLLTGLGSFSKDDRFKTF